MASLTQHQSVAKTFPDFSFINAQMHSFWSLQGRSWLEIFTICSFSYLILLSKNFTNHEILFNLFNAKDCKLENYKKKHDFIVLRLTCAPDDQSLVQSFSQLFIDNPPPACRSNLLQCYLLFEGSIIYYPHRENIFRGAFQKGEIQNCAGNILDGGIKDAVMLEI